MKTFTLATLSEYNRLLFHINGDSSVFNISYVDGKLIYENDNLVVSARQENDAIGGDNSGKTYIYKLS